MRFTFTFILSRTLRVLQSDSDSSVTVLTASESSPSDTVELAIDHQSDSSWNPPLRDTGSTFSSEFASDWTISDLASLQPSDSERSSSAFADVSDSESASADDQIVTDFESSQGFESILDERHTDEDSLTHDVVEVEDYDFLLHSANDNFSDNEEIWTLEARQTFRARMTPDCLDTASEDDRDGCIARPNSPAKLGNKDV